VIGNLLSDVSRVRTILWWRQMMGNGGIRVVRALPEDCPLLNVACGLSICGIPCQYGLCKTVGWYSGTESHSHQLPERCNEAASELRPGPWCATDMPSPPATSLGLFGRTNQPCICLLVFSMISFNLFARAYARPQHQALPVCWPFRAGMRQGQGDNDDPIPAAWCRRSI
jgi:hypothetical protein